MIEFRAAFLEQLDAPLKVSTVRTNAALAPGQVLVAIEALGICGSQLLEISGKKGNARFLPHLLGHEGVGKVVDCGALVSTVKAGDRVVLHWRKGDGLEAPPATYVLPDGTSIGSGPISVFSEMSIVSENRVTAISAEFDASMATLLGCGLSTGLGVVDKEINFRLGESLLVLGAGGVGLAAAIGASIKGAARVVVADMQESKRQTVEGVPGAVFVNTSNTTWDEEVRSSAPLGFNYVLEATGSQGLRELALSFLATNGTLVVVGQGDSEEGLHLGRQKDAFGADGTTVVFSQGGSFNPPYDIPRYAAALSRHMTLLDLISTSQSGSLVNINDLVELQQSGNSPRQILRLTS